MKENKRQAEVINRLLYEVEKKEQSVKRAARSKNFVDKAVNYYNVLSFTSEHIDNKNLQASAWSICRIQGGIHH